MTHMPLLGSTALKLRKGCRSPESQGIWLLGSAAGVRGHNRRLVKLLDGSSLIFPPLWKPRLGKFKTPSLVAVGILLCVGQQQACSHVFGRPARGLRLP